MGKRQPKKGLYKTLKGEDRESWDRLPELCSVSDSPRLGGSQEISGGGRKIETTSLLTTEI